MLRVRKGGRRLRIFICIFYGAKGVQSGGGGAKGIEGCAKEVVFLHLYLNGTWCEGSAKKVRGVCKGGPREVQKGSQRGAKGLTLCVPLTVPGAKGGKVGVKGAERKCEGVEKGAERGCIPLSVPLTVPGAKGVRRGCKGSAKGVRRGYIPLSVPLKVPSAKVVRRVYKLVQRVARR